MEKLVIWPKRSRGRQTMKKMDRQDQKRYGEKRNGMTAAWRVKSYRGSYKRVERLLIKVQTLL